jgi:hypothetical protein
MLSGVVARITFYSPMRRPRRSATRLVAALTALVTVWCLGCSAFDPLVEHLLGVGSGMVCSSEGGAVIGSEMPAAGMEAETPTSTASQSHGVSTVSATQDSGASGISCGCQSCTAPSPAMQVVASPAVVSPEAHVWSATTLLDIEHEPLVPPPQLAL